MSTCLGGRKLRPGGREEIGQGPYSWEVRGQNSHLRSSLSLHGSMVPRLLSVPVLTIFPTPTVCFCLLKQRLQ